MKDHQDCAVEDNGSDELSLPKTNSQHQMGSTIGLNLLDIECTTNASLPHEESNTKDTLKILLAEKERFSLHTSIGAESEGGTTCGNKL